MSRAYAADLAFARSNEEGREGKKWIGVDWKFIRGEWWNGTDKGTFFFHVGIGRIEEVVRN